MRTLPVQKDPKSLQRLQLLRPASRYQPTTPLLHRGYLAVTESSFDLEGPARELVPAAGILPGRRLSLPLGLGRDSFPLRHVGTVDRVRTFGRTFGPFDLP